MTQLFEIHPQNPQVRLVRQAVSLMREGSLIVYPTDSCYAFGCMMDQRRPPREIARLRGVGRDHNFTLVCRDLSEIATYAKVANWQYRLLKAHTPGPYTFILPATRDVPRRLQNEKRRTIGIRIPDHAVPAALVEELGEPLMSSTLSLSGEDLPLTDPGEIYDRLAGEVDLIIDSGNCGLDPTTVIELTSEVPKVLREGKGDVAPFN